MSKFESIFKEFLKARGYADDVQCSVSRIDMLETIIRVDKRRVYYQFYHRMEIDELKHAALYVYWILKLRPFVMTDHRYAHKKEYCDINEMFSLYLIMLTLAGTHRLTIPLAGDEPEFKDLRYSFRYRNISIDAMVVLVESLNDASFFPK